MKFLREAGQLVCENATKLEDKESSVLAKKNKKGLTLIMPSPESHPPGDDGSAAESDDSSSDNVAASSKKIKK